MSKVRWSVAESPEMLARKALDEDGHYLGAIARMAAVQEIVTREAVYSASGVKLIDKGVRIDGGLRERLVQHRLLKPIDQTLEVKDGVDAGLLGDELVRLAAAPPLRRLLGDEGAELASCVAALRQLKLPDQLAFKLTVMRARMPWLFAHVLVVALISHCLALRLRLPPAVVEDVLLTCLTHDLGELHTDPALLDRRHRMDDTELRYLDVHPITGYLIAKEILPGHPAVAAGVLQHQERLDGSGYPNRLHGDGISRLARIVAVADACASIVIRADDSERLNVWMRLNRGKYDNVLIALLRHGEWRDTAAADGDSEPTAAEIEATARLLLRWNEFSRVPPGGPSPATAFLFERMADLRVVLLQFGLDPDRPQSLRALAGEPGLARELAAAFDEVRHQITDIQRETLRRREAIAQSPQSADLASLDAWLAEIRDYLRDATPPGRVPSPERRHNTAPR